VCLLGQPLERADLEPAMAAMREHLIGKNVATEIADRLCESVLANMVGKKPGTFKSTSCTDSVRLCVCVYVYVLERERERERERRMGIRGQTQPGECSWPHVVALRVAVFVTHA
jgi:signal recognition particle GTPase